MPIEKINFHYPKNSLQGVYDTDTLTALELASKTSKKVDECVDAVNGVELTAIQSAAIVEQMQIVQEQFTTENNDIRASLVTDNQAFINGLEASQLTFENLMTDELAAFVATATTNLSTQQTALNDSKAAFEASMTTELNSFIATTAANMATHQDSLNASKTAFETQMAAAVTDIITNADATIEADVSTKINTMATDGSLSAIINDELLAGINSDIALLEAEDMVINENLVTLNNQAVKHVSNTLAVGDGVVNDTTPIKTLLESGGRIVFPENKTYLLTDSVYMPANTTIDLKGSTINFVLADTIPGFHVIGDNVAIENGSIFVVGSLMGGNGHALNCITAGWQSTGEGYKNLTFRNLTVSTNRNDAGATIGIMGECSNVLIENITVPNNPNCRNIIGCEWGGTPQNGTGHPYNIIIRNVKIGELSYPTYGSAGYAYGAYISAAFNVNIENMTMEKGHGLVYFTRGDNANTYAKPQFKELIGTGLSIKNSIIKNCFGYGIRVIGSHLSATLDPIPMNALIENVKIIGGKIATNLNFGANVEQSKNVVFRNIEIEGIIDVGMAIGLNTENIVIENGTIKNCNLYGISLNNNIINPIVQNIMFKGCNKNAGSGSGTAAITLGSAKNPKIINCTFGEIGVSETQKYSIYCGASTVEPYLSNNKTQALAAGGFAYLIDNSCLMPHGDNNYSEPGINNHSGQPIYRINTNGDRDFVAAAIPTTGAYNVGDKMFYITPAASGFIGAVCVEAGTPGIWKTFGAITA